MLPFRCFSLFATLMSSTSGAAVPNNSDKMRIGYWAFVLGPLLSVGAQPLIPVNAQVYLLVSSKYDCNWDVKAMAESSVPGAGERESDTGHHAGHFAVRRASGLPAMFPIWNLTACTPSCMCTRHTQKGGQQAACDGRTQPKSKHSRPPEPLC